MKRASEGIGEQVAALGKLSREELAVLWLKDHNQPPPKGIRHELLVRSAAWHLQAKHFGGLSPATRRALRLAMAEVQRSHRKAPAPATSDDGYNAATLMAASPRRRQPAPGGRLLRDWNGKTHVVEVVDKGFVFQAKVYPSLTAIARQITGAHWSGPRFFGL